MQLPISLLEQEIDLVYTRIREMRVTPTASVQEVRDAVERAFDLERARPLEEVVGAATALLREHSLVVTHPRYFGLFNPSVHPSGIIADALVALHNPQVGGWSHAPAANEMERLVLRRITRAFGLEEAGVTAHFTSGGNEANHTAIITALAHRHPEWSTDGVRALNGQPAIYLSAESHHSFTKIARGTGLGVHALRLIDVDEKLRMRTDRLSECIARDRAIGMVPLAVVGTAGTTGAGAIDPLPAIAAICEREELWFHVDAAWGGAAAFVPRLAHVLEGVGRADSLTFDAHKWLSVPLGAGIFFTRHAAALGKAFGVDTGYVPPTEHGAVDLYKTSMQWSRRFIGLKVLFALAEHGVDGIGRFIANQAEMGDLIRERLAAAGWKLVNDTPLPLVCFTHPDLPSDEASVRKFVDTVLARGRVWVSSVRIPGAGWALRACVTSFRTNADDIAILMEELGESLAATRGG